MSGLAMKEALVETALYREFAGLFNVERIPDRVSILRFRRLLEKHQLAQQILVAVNAILAHKGLILKQGKVVVAALVAAPISTKNQSDERNPEELQTKKANHWQFSMRAQIVMDADSGLVNTVFGTAANANDVKQAGGLVQGEEANVFADAGYQGVAKREVVQRIEAKWYVAQCPGKRRALDKGCPMGAALDQLEHVKAHFRAKVEHPLRAVKRQFGHMKVVYRGLAKKTGPLHTLGALSNLWMAQRRLLQGLRA